MKYVKSKLKKRYYKYLRWRYGGRYFGSNFTHPLIKNYLPDVITSEAIFPVPESLLMSLSRSYLLSAQNYRTSGDIWLDLESKRSDYISALKDCRFGDLTSYYSRMLKDDLVEGMGHSEALFVDESNNPYSTNYFQLRTIDALMSLGEALGVYSALNPVQMKLVDLIDHMNPDLEQLTEKIQTALGFEISMPMFGNPPVIDEKLRLNPDGIRHAYTIHRLKSLGADEDSVILEIGGGYGMAALLAYRAGLRNYMIVDIPYVASLQGAYLGGTIGENQVVLANGASSWVKGKVHIDSPDRIDRLLDNSVDFVVNTDSLPEMPYAVARHYASSIVRVCQGIFLSINQEARAVYGGLQQGAVRELMGEHRITASHRFRHWMEHGYVEEIFDLSRPLQPLPSVE